MSHWIKVEDKLPLLNTYCLAHCEGGNIDTSFFADENHYVGERQYFKPTNTLSDGFEIARRYNYEVTHWMPLPEAPEPEIPFLAVGAHELDDNPDVGETIMCPHCKKEHPIRYGTDEDGNETKLLACYKCPLTDKLYLAGVGGKLL